MDSSNGSPIKQSVVIGTIKEGNLSKGRKICQAKKDRGLGMGILSRKIRSHNTVRGHVPVNGIGKLVPLGLGARKRKCHKSGLDFLVARGRLNDETCQRAERKHNKLSHS